MREILFRGKSEDNGEWVYGYYACIGKHHYILTGKLNLIGAVNFEHYLVIPETVCQFTGLYDKNGKKIFEGDIVRDTETSDVGAICFETNTATFVIEFDSIIVNFYDYNNSDVEVIGNIHDNHELLEGGE